MLRRLCSPLSKCAFDDSVANLAQEYSTVDLAVAENVCDIVRILLLRGCKDEHDSRQAGRTWIDPDESEGQHAQIAPLIEVFRGAIEERPLSTVDEVAGTIARSWEDWKSGEPDLALQTTRLVECTYGLGLCVGRELPGVAERWLGAPMPGSISGNAGVVMFSAAEKPTATEAQLFDEILNYGLTSNADKIGELESLYKRRLGDLPVAARMRMLLHVVYLAEKQQVSINAFNPFLYCDPDHAIVSSAALHAAGTWPQSDLDPLIGVKSLWSSARHHMREGGSEASAVSIVSGLLMLGDRRVIEVLGHCWRDFSLEGRVSLSHARTSRIHATFIDWLLDWLEDSEGGEFGAVAAALARSTERARDEGVFEVRRAMPVWSAEPDKVIDVITTWSFAEFVKRIRRRLLQIAADEGAPRVMYQVLRSWGVDHTQRLDSQVALHMADCTGLRRPLLPLLPAQSLRRNKIFGYAPLRDDDFLAADGRLLLSWVIFNPLGPTWSCIGLLPTEDSDTGLLFYRMLNPFGQQSGAIATVDSSWLESASELIGEMFKQNQFSSSDGESVVMLGGGTPTCIEAHLTDPEFLEAMPNIFASSPTMLDFDVQREIDWIGEFAGRPWDRALAQVQSAASLGPDGLIDMLTLQKPTTPEVVKDWFALVTNSQHKIAELINIPGAWHGAIDNAAEAVGRNAYTFWQLDNFLESFGYTMFRDIAKTLEFQAE